MPNTSNYGWAFIHPVYGQAQARGDVYQIQFQTDTIAIDNNKIGVGSGSANLTFNYNTNALALTGAMSTTGDLTVGGDLTVNGNSTIIDASTMVIEDSIIGLGFTSADNTTGSAGDRGLILGITGGTNKGMIWDNDASEFAFINTDSNPSATAVNVTGYNNLRIGSILKLSHATGGPHATVEIDSDGDLNLKATHTNADITFTVDDNGTDITALTLDGADLGNAKFTPANGGYLSIDDADNDGKILLYGNGQGQFYMHSDTPTASPSISLFRSRGSEGGSEASLQANDSIGKMFFYGYDNGTSPAAGIEVFADAEHNTSSDTSDSPGRMEFKTTPDGSDTMVTAMTIKNDGNVGIGIDVPSAPLEVAALITQQKWSYDTDSSATMTVANASHTTLATAETGNLILDAAGNIELNADAGTISFKDDSASYGSVSSSGWQFDANVTVAASKVISMGGNKVTNVTDPTNAQDAATLNYVSTTIAALDLDVDGDSASTFTMNLATDDLGIKGTANNISTNASGTDVTIDLIDAGPGALTKGDGSNIPTVQIDAKGRVIALSHTPVVFNYVVATGGGTITIGHDDTLQITGSTNEIEVSVNDLGDVTKERLTIGLPNDVTISNNLTVTSDLIVDTNTLCVDASNNKVGIGTTNAAAQPAEKNDLVIGDHTGNRGMTIASTNTGVGTIRFAPNTSANDIEGWIDYSGNSKKMRFGTNGLNTRMTIDNVGNVGIGLSSPLGKLHVLGGSAGGATPVSWADELVLETGGGGGLSILFPNANSGNVVFGTSSDPDAVALRGYYNSGTPKLEIETAGTARLHASSAGVGIGMTAPNAALTVEGAISLDYITSPTATAGYGKLFAKADNKLYFMDGSGAETNLFTVESVQAVERLDGAALGGGAAFTVLTSHQIIGVITQAGGGGGVVTVNLPDPRIAAGNEGRVYIIKDIGNNADNQNIALTTSGAGCNVEGASSHTLGSKGSAVQLFSDGYHWWVY